MPTFQPYAPEQAELLPAHVRDVLQPNHLCFLIHEVVEALDVGEFVAAYSDQGGQSPYHPRLMLKVWLYAFAVNVRTTRKLEQRLREDLAFRFLAGGASPDHKTLSEFQRQHGERIRRLFGQVLELIQRAGMAKLGTVAIDSTRVKASASRERVLRQRELQAKVAQWQRGLDEDPERTPGTQVSSEEQEKVRQQLQRLQQLGENKLSQTDPDARFLRDASGFTLGYTGELAVTADHVIVAARVTQNKSDNESLLPMIEQVEHSCRRRPDTLLADTGFFTAKNMEAVEQLGIDAYVPDANLSKELKGGASADVQKPSSTPVLQRMRKKLRTPEGRQHYARRKIIVEPVFGVLKQQRGMRQFYRRGLAMVSIEWTLAAIAYNLTRLYHHRMSR